jgi:hypothetical protein
VHILKQIASALGIRFERSGEALERRAVRFGGRQILAVLIRGRPHDPLV